MDVRVLRNYLVVAREQNITRAAESLHIAQPSLSEQMLELEKELGKPLLIRGKRKLTLTADGALLRKRAGEILSLMEKTQAEVSSGAAEIGGRIAVGGSPPEKLLRAAAALREKHPAVQFDFYASDATDVIERLDHGSLDFAVLLEPVDAVKYEYLSLGDSARWGLLMPSECALAQKPAVGREDAAQQETQNFLDRVYQGSLRMLVSTMTQKKAVSKEELDELYALLREMEEKA